MSDVCAKFIVTGRVQGVWFRASTVKQALALQLCGYAKNLPDGTVEVLAEGDEASVRSLELWLASGPPLARVDSVRRLDCEPQQSRGFVQL